MPTTAHIDVPVKCTRILEQEGRDVEERKHPVGTAVLCNPLAPHVFMKDTPENRTRFRKRGYTWDSTWPFWFLQPDDWDGQTVERLNAVTGLREQFAATLHQNLLAATGKAFPEVKMPLWLHLLPFEWEPRIKQVRETADLSTAMTEVLREMSGSPAGLKWPAEWAMLLKDLNHVKVYSVEGWRRCLHVVVVFAAPLVAKEVAPPALLPLDGRIVEAVRGIYDTWRNGQDLTAPSFVYFTIAGAMDAAPPVGGSVHGGEWRLVSFPANDAQWETRQPPRFGDRIALRDFLDRLEPLTEPERVSRVKDSVDAMIAEGGNVTVARTAGRVGYRRSVIRQAFLMLQERASDSYRLYRTSSGEIAVRAARPGEKVSLTSASFRRGFFRRHGLQLLGVVLGVSSWTLGGTADLPVLAGFVVFLSLVYATSCVQATVNRQAKDKE